MKAVIRYVAEDGSEWREQSDAVKRDEQVRAVQGVMVHLKPKPNDTNFSNGGGYVQQDPGQVQRCRAALLDVAITAYPDMAEQLERCKQPDVSLSWVLRFIDDHGPVSRALSRLYCIDDRAREWGQPYFVLNPGTGERREWGLTREPR